MSRNLRTAMARTARREVEDDGRWVFYEPGIVVDNKDPEGRHRVKVLWPSIDEDEALEDWISPATTFADGDGFGSVFLPAIGSEVMISGRRGQKYNFVYHGANYNEEVKTPDLGEDTQGMKLPKNLSFIATLLFKIESLENNVEILAAEIARLQGKNVEVIAEELAKTEAENIHTLSLEENRMTGNNTIVEGATDVTVDSEGTVHIQGNGPMTVHSDANVAVTSGGAMSIAGSGPMTISGSATISITAVGALMLQGRLVNKPGPPI